MQLQVQWDAFGCSYVQDGAGPDGFAREVKQQSGVKNSRSDGGDVGVQVLTKNSKTKYEGRCRCVAETSSPPSEKIYEGKELLLPFLAESMFLWLV